MNTVSIQIILNILVKIIQTQIERVFLIRYLLVVPVSYVVQWGLLNLKTYYHWFVEKRELWFHKIPALSRNINSGHIQFQVI